MLFKLWLISETDYYQKVFPYMQEEEPPDVNKIKRYKSMDNYVKAMQKGGRQTEVAAEKLISSPASGYFIGNEELIELIPDAVSIPPKEFPNGTLRPEFRIAIAHLKTVQPIQSYSEKYNNKHRYRILAYWQGKVGSTFTKENVFEDYRSPIGGLSYIGGYIDTVWVDPSHRGNYDISLYKELREFAKRRGIISLAPDDDLTSKSFRAAQAKYDWNRASSILGKQNDL